jgi:hypothetical protein
MAKGNGKKRADKASGQASGLVPQPHGGALLPGAGGGAANGSLGGRPPSAIREHCRGAFADRVPILEAIADGKPLKMVKVTAEKRLEMEVSASVKERVQAIDVLAKYGGVDKLALTADEQPEQAMTPERVADMWLRLQQIRTVRQLEKLLVGDGSD